MFKNWQYKNRQKLSELPINKIIVPGTHDSGAYDVIFNKSLKGGQKLWEILRIASRFAPWVYFIVRSWTLCQNKNFYQQLNAGIRSFDIRLTYREADDRWYISHTLLTCTVEDMIKQTVQFLNENPYEFIIFQIKFDYNNRKLSNSINDNSIKSKFWKELNKDLNFSTRIYQGNLNDKLDDEVKQVKSSNIPTYSELLRLKKNIILLPKDTIYSDNQYGIQNVLSQNNNLNQFWSDTREINDWNVKNKKFLDKLSVPTNKFNELLCTLTGDGDTIISDIICIVIQNLSYGCLIVSIILFGIFFSKQRKISFGQNFKDNKGKFITSIVFFVLFIGIYVSYFVIKIKKKSCVNRYYGVLSRAEKVQNAGIKMLSSKKYDKHLSIITCDFPTEKFIETIINKNF